MEIKVVEQNSGEVLDTFTIEQREDAYQKATEYEALGLEVKIVSPSIGETLTESLGLKTEDKEKYLESMDEEMEHHEGGCCIELPPSNAKQLS